MTEILTIVLEQLPGFAAGVSAVILAVLPVFLSQRSQRREIARALGTLALEVLDSVREARLQLDLTTKPGAGALTLFFKARPAVVPDYTLTPFSQAVQRSAALQCFGTWRTALNSLKSLEKLHSELRNLAGRPRAGAVIHQSQASYLQLLQEAERELTEALDITTKYTPREVTSQIKGRLRRPN